MDRDRDVERFGRWADTYDRSYLQRLIFEPVHRALLDIAVAARPDAMAILDVGCGTGRLLLAAAEAWPRARLSGVDAAGEMADVARARLGEGADVRQAIAESLPFADAAFDLVFSTMTFHHWADQWKGSAEVARVMRPGARWLLADFVATGLMRYVKRALRLKRFRERRELDAILHGAGLEVVESRRVQGVGSQVPILVIKRA